MAELLTASQVAERWGCTRFWVNSLIRRGKLKAEKLGGMYMIKVRDADAYKHQPGGRPSNGTRRRRPRKKQPHKTKAARRATS